MNTHDAHLERFFEDIPFPISRSALVEESLESPLPQDIRDAIMLLPDREYNSKEELTQELLDISPEDADDGIPKKDPAAADLEDVDDKMDSLVNLDEFTQMGDEEDHESV